MKKQMLLISALACVSNLFAMDKGHTHSTMLEAIKSGKLQPNQEINYNGQFYTVAEIGKNQKGFALYRLNQPVTFGPLDLGVDQFTVSSLDETPINFTSGIKRFIHEPYRGIGHALLGGSSVVGLYLSLMCFSKFLQYVTNQ